MTAECFIKYIYLNADRIETLCGTVKSLTITLRFYIIWSVGLPIYQKLDLICFHWSTIILGLCSNIFIIIFFKFNIDYLHCKQELSIELYLNKCRIAFTTKYWVSRRSQWGDYCRGNEIWFKINILYILADILYILFTCHFRHYWLYLTTCLFQSLHSIWFKVRLTNCPSTLVSRS